LDFVILKTEPTGIAVTSSFHHAKQFCTLACFLAWPTLSAFCQSAFPATDQWTDASGKHSVEAVFISLEEGLLVLRCKDGKQVRIPYDNLDKESQKQANVFASKKNDVPRRNAFSGKIENVDMLESIAKKQREASQAFELYKSFLARPNLEPEERAKAEERISKWQKRAKKDLWRWGNQWVPMARIRERIKDEDRLILEAHRFIEIGNDELARDRLAKASGRNPESIRGDFYLGILHALIGRNAASAKSSFSKCISRLERTHGELSGIRRSNLIAALNNRAICLARMGKHSQAIKDWDVAIELAPLTPELVQNLGYYAKIASVFSGWGLPHRGARRISEQYAKVSVTNRAAAFMENVGWLFIPYIDVPLLPDFEDIQFGDNGDIKIVEVKVRRY